MGTLKKLGLALGMLLVAFATTASTALAGPQFEFLKAGVSNLQAAGHPDSVVDFKFAVEPTLEPVEAGEVVVVGGTPQDIVATLPRGYYGNPQNFATCPTPRLAAGCPITSQVGTAFVKFSRFVDTLEGEENQRINDPGASTPVFNMDPQRGEVARLGLRVLGTITSYVSVKLRPGDYRIEATASKISALHEVYRTHMTLWGNPYGPDNDYYRGCEAEQGQRGCQVPLGTPLVPFITAPVECNTAEVTTMEANSWIDPDHWTRAISVPQQMTGCDQVEFSPSIEARPSTNLADAPSGLDVKLHFPQNEDVDGLATAQLRDAVLTLPEGMTVNPPSADGLDACSMQEVGISAAKVPDGDPVKCPDASKIGTLTAVSPPLENPLQGSVYLAEQNDNPFNSLLALYFVLEDPERGILVKLAGEAEADPQTGQITTLFTQNPQLPVEDLEVHLKQGPRAPLKTPANCGTHTSTSTLTPWTSPEGADAKPTDSFSLTRGPDGKGCLPSGSSAPNSPSLTAGTVDPTAGAYSPFVLKLTRQDGTQPIKRIEATLPKGLLGKLAGIPYCSDQALASASGKSGRAEQSSSSCPAVSKVGSVTVAAGAGSLPLNVGGDAYLAGPYRGAPLSMAILTPAVAGPFDLGTVVVRTALNVDPVSTQIKAVSDEIPTILQGIPLDVRSISVKLDKPSFTLNPTSCEKTEVFASATSVFDQSAQVKSPFQVGGCAALGFKPKLTFALTGKTHRSGHPALKATLSARAGDANIGRAQVTLPKSQFLDQSHIRTICTRVQYAANACPPASIYGKAKAWSPLLDQPLSGPVYLRSSSNLLPDLVAKLDGQIHIDLVGRIDSVKERLRSTFDSVPDAPVSRFVLEMQGGKKGLLVNNTELCKAKPKANVMLDGQNGKTHDFNAVVKVDCGKKKGKKEKKRAGKRGKK